MELHVYVYNILCLGAIINPSDFFKRKINWWSTHALLVDMMHFFSQKMKLERINIWNLSGNEVKKQVVDHQIGLKPHIGGLCPICSFFEKVGHPFPFGDLISKSWSTRIYTLLIFKIFFKRFWFMKYTYHTVALLVGKMFMFFRNVQNYTVFRSVKKKFISVIGHQIGVKPSKGRVCLTYCVQIERVSFENWKKKMD